MKHKNDAVVIVYVVYSNADALSLRAYRSGTKLEKTSLSTDGKQGSAYGIHNMHNSEPANMSVTIICEKLDAGEISCCKTGNVQYRQNKGDLPLLRSPFLSILNISVTC